MAGVESGNEDIDYVIYVFVNRIYTTKRKLHGGLIWWIQYSILKNKIYIFKPRVISSLYVILNIFEFWEIATV